jgi:hypothetical protein
MNLFNIKKYYEVNTIPLIIIIFIELTLKIENILDVKIVLIMTKKILP